eukprot:gene5480-biopygen3654
MHRAAVRARGGPQRLAGVRPRAERSVRRAREQHAAAHRRRRVRDGDQRQRLHRHGVAHHAQQPPGARLPGPPRPLAGRWRTASLLGGLGGLSGRLGGLGGLSSAALGGFGGLLADLADSLADLAHWRTWRTDGLGALADTARWRTRRTGGLGGLGPTDRRAATRAPRRRRSREQQGPGAAWPRRGAAVHGSA